MVARLSTKQNPAVLHIVGRQARRQRSHGGAHAQRQLPGRRHPPGQLAALAGQEAVDDLKAADRGE